MSRLGANFLRHAMAPAVVSLIAVAGLGCLLLAVQVLSRAPVIPGPQGAWGVVLGMLPAALDAAVPAAVLVGLVSAARGWALGGEWRALAASGHGARRLLPMVLGASLVGAVGQAVLSHHAAPAGRRAARGALLTAAADLGLRAGQPLVLPRGVLHARAVQGRNWEGVFFAQDQTVVSARRGRVEGGTLVLEDGTARTIEAEGRMRFARARVPLTLPGRRFELAERGFDSLSGLLERKRRRGERAAYETLILYKRTTSALAIPLFAALALPLGARRRRAAPVTLVVLLGWWLSIRIADQSVDLLGAMLAAMLPLGLLGASTAVAWLRWEAR